VKLPRRAFLHLAAGVAWLPALARFAWAQTYPSRPVHWIVGFTPAGGNDIVARLMGQWLSVGQSFVIEQARPQAWPHDAPVKSSFVRAARASAGVMSAADPHRT
jgi:hypothetical protein